MFFHVRVPKRRISMNVQVDATPNVDWVEIPIARSDGGDI